MSDEASALEPARARASLSPQQLYRHCPIEAFDFKTTDELEPLAEPLGQQRVLAALDFGLNVAQEGFNIFLLGNPGVGKRDLLENLLQDQRSTQRAEVDDWCYVNNFDFPDKPIALRLPRGMGIQLRDDMAAAVEDLLAIMPATFQGDEYQARVQELGEHYQEREKEAFQDLAEKAQAEDIAMLQTPSGYTLAPMKDGEIITPQDFEKQPEAQKRATLEAIEKLKEELKVVVRQLPGWKKESHDQFRELNAEFSGQAIDPILNLLKSKYQGQPRVLEFLDSVHKSMMEDAERFTQLNSESAIPDNIKERIKEFPQYSVNVMIDNSGQQDAPVIYEDNPSFANLIGRSEHIAQMGTLVTDFTLIKPGALHRANGGYLVLEADKVLTNPYAWTALKRALRGREVRIQSLDQIFSFVSTVQLEPEPIALDIKLVLTGSRYIYYLLQEYDPDFASLFKVTADMSEEVDWDTKSTEQFARLVRELQSHNKLLPISNDGVARVIEQSSRLMQDSKKLSLHREQLGNLLAESDFVARREDASVITSAHVGRAIEAARHRLDQFRDKSAEGILRDIMLVQTEGKVIGQVNGLSVFLLGDYSFGKPTRITATARLGQGKVLDIEREVDLGGKIHSKAVLIISALLAQRYARERPLPLAATLVFEQSYGGIEGDSASVAEYAALVSAIADIPLRQEIAATGSLNQQGQLQAIGGVNEKIEGFFDICSARGLSKSQGVVIPAANQIHLMLREDVRKAVENGQFHIYTAEVVEDALEILTGHSAPSIERVVNDRLEKLLTLAREFADKSTPGNEGGEDRQ